MTIQKKIEEKLQAEFSPETLQVINESVNHSVPKGSETHFRVEMVSAQFISLSRVERFQLVHQVLSQELEQAVHALSLKLFTPEEFTKRQQSFGASSPECAHNTNSNK